MPKGQKPTERQKRIVEAYIENSRKPKKERKSKGELMMNVGYPKNTAIKPSQVFESQGVKTALAKYGLTEGFITKELVHDIEHFRGQRRTHELALGASVLGMTKPDTTNILINTSQDKREEINKAFEGMIHAQDERDIRHDKHEDEG